MSGDITKYLDRIPSANRHQPRFIAAVSALVQPFADLIEFCRAAITAYDLDTATGVQLDAVGEWVGLSRNIDIPLNVYFSLDVVGLGLDEGLLFMPYMPLTGLTSLTDDAYRTLLRAGVAANHWDGSLPDAYRLLELVFPNHLVLIQLSDQMDWTLAIIGPPPDAVTLALFFGGYLNIKPAGERVHYIYSSGPVFGLNVNNDRIGGLDYGYLA